MLRDLPRTAIVIPCYNEGRRLRVAAFAEFLETHLGIELFFVNDGSTDSTSEILTSLVRAFPDRCTFEDCPVNAGKGEAVRKGVLLTLLADRFDFVGYWDADLSTPISDVLLLLDAATKDPATRCVCGSRVRRLGAVIQRKWYKHYLGRVFATICGILLRIPVYDTQCGAKLFHVELARVLFEEPFLSRWLFDVELFARCVRFLGREETERMVVELPLFRWVDSADSKLKLRNYVAAPIHLFRIACHYRVWR